MLTIPSALWPFLQAQAFRPIEVVELEPLDTLASGEVLTNGGVETWTSPTDAGTWVEVITGGTVNREAAGQRTGTYAARFDRTGAGSLYFYQQRTGLVPGKWYRFEAWVKGSGTAVAALTVNRLSDNFFLKTDNSWAAGSVPAATVSAGATYQRLARWVFIDPAMAVSDTVHFWIGSDAASSNGSSVYADDISVLGPFDRPTLYYAGRSVVWNGDTYSGLVKARNRIKFTKALTAPDTAVSFSNVAGALTAYLYPVDQLTGARLTIRLLVDDGTGTPLPDSLILFRGIVEPPKRITEEEFVLSATGLLDSGGLEIPARRLQLTCPWTFANDGAFDGGGECAYVSNTTAVGAGASSTALTLAAASTFANGDVIQVGGGAEVAISSGGGTVNLVLASARTWSNGATVRYSTCDFSRPACEKRNQLYRMGGFPGASAAARLKERDRQREARQDRTAARRASLANKANMSQTPFHSDRRATALYADPTISLPIVYGRRRFDPVQFELRRKIIGSEVHRTAFYAMCEGPIDSVVEAYAEDVRIVDEIQGTVKTFGIYVRLGGIGVNDFETEAEYNASPAPRVRSQNIDWKSFSSLAFSETAYVIFIQVIKSDSTPLTDEAPRFEVDVRGSQVQIYDAAGAPVGGLAWSESPIWCSVDLLLSKRKGRGLKLTDVDHAVHVGEAAYGDVLISGVEARTTVSTSQASTKSCLVQSSEGFVIGRRVDVNSVANTVEAIPSDREITLGTAVAQTSGWSVVQRPKRFETHVVLDRVDAPIRWLESILASCRGYVTYDAGKIQLRIERDTVKERLLNPKFDGWASATDADSWVEAPSAEGTLNRDSTIKVSGLYSMRIDRTAGSLFTGFYQDLVGLEPGRWYRLTFWHKQSATGAPMSTALRMQILNGTRGVAVDADGVTWFSSPSCFLGQGSTTFTKYEITFRIREDFAITDTYRIQCAPYFPSSGGAQSVWYDDFELRGPYAGDFREATTALLMGWKEGSFQWSLDTKDRQTNRIAIRFVNQSGRFGDDEIAVNDLVHQRSHAVTTKRINGDGFIDRDQATRIAQTELARLRTLGPGCEFLGSPPALALQPGDVILVSHTVPGWTCKEQRVTEVEVLGKGDDDEHFVTVRTEDYLEAIYSDVGPPQNSLPTRPVAVIAVTILRHTGSLLELSWSISVDTTAVSGFRIHSSATAGFTPDVRNQIGETVAHGFVYEARLDEIEQVRYYRVVAVTDYGPTLQSVEFTATIFAVDYDATDGTHGENNADGNMVYDSDFQGTEFPGGGTTSSDGWTTNSLTTYTDRDATVNLNPAVGGESAFTNPTQAYDNNAGTYAVGTASWDGASVTVRASIRFGFAAATRTGRGKIIVKRTSATAAGSILLEFATDGGTVWTQFGAATGSIDQTFYTPTLDAQIMANFFLRVRVGPKSAGTANSITASVAEVDFQEESAGSIISHLVNGKLELKGDGTNYAEARRRFPGKAPGASGIYLTTGTPNRWEIKVQHLNPGGGTPGPLEIRLEDAATGTVWTIGSVIKTDIVDGWTAFTGLFDPGGTPVSGQLDIVIRTKCSTGYRVDQVLIARQVVITAYQVSSEDQQLGRFPDLTAGEAVNWPKGKLTVAAGYRKVTLT